MKASRKSLFVLITFILLVISLIFGIVFGAVKLPFANVLKTLISAFMGSDKGTVSSKIVIDLRVPRVLLALMVGGGLSVSGVAVQALFRNPLAEPYLLGISGGAAFGASLFTLLGVLGLTLPPFIGLAGFAFVFSLLSVFVVYRIALVRGTIPGERLLLAGIALSFLFSAFTAFFLYLTVTERPQLLFWLLGGFSRARWSTFYSLAPIVVIGSFLLFTHWRELNAFLLGEEEALSIGVPVERVKKTLLVLVALITGASVSAAGIIGFIGLMVPHISRRLVGGDHRILIAESFLMGGLLLILCDLIARTVLSPVEIPVGIVTSFLGVPFFLWLLRRRSFT